MQRSLILVTLAFVSVSLGHNVLAAETEPTPGPAALDGRYGLVFGFDGDRLSPFDGAMFALRKQVGQRTGLRLGLSLGFTDLDRDQEAFSETETISPDSTENVVNDRNTIGEEDSLDLEVDLLLIRHAKSTHRLRFFYGAGPMVSTRQSSTNDRIQGWEDGQVIEETRETTSTTWRYGLRLVAGVEYFFTDAISVHAEYRAGVLYRDQESTSETIREILTEDEGTSDQRRRSFSSYSTQGWEVSDHMARFGVSLFF